MEDSCAYATATGHVVAIFPHKAWKSRSLVEHGRGLAQLPVGRLEDCRSSLLIAHVQESVAHERLKTTR